MSFGEAPGPGDVSILLEDGRLQIIGQYAIVRAERRSPNHVELFTDIPGGVE